MSRTRFMFTALALMVVGALAASCAAAADPPANPPPRTRGQGGGNAMGLLNNEKVQADLSLTDSQKESIKKLQDAAREARSSLSGLSQEDRRAKTQEMAKENEEKLGAILDDKQKSRLKEIRLQTRGASALADKEVAEALKLTDDQVNKIKEITESTQKEMQEAFQSAANGGDRTAVREKATKLRTESSEKILAVLNADQKASFEKMQGTKIEGLPQGGAGFGGGRGGRRGGNGNGN